MSEFSDLLTDLNAFTPELSDAFYDKALAFTNVDSSTTSPLDLSLAVAVKPEEIQLFPDEPQGAKYIGEFKVGQSLPGIKAKAAYLGGVLELIALLDMNAASLGTPALFVWRR